MNTIVYIDRETGKECVEQVYGAKALELLYGDDWLSKIFGAPLLHAFAKFPLWSSVYGLWQKAPWSKSKVQPFIENFSLNEAEFLEDPKSYRSFNDFFVRKLKPCARPIAEGKEKAILPADARYLFYQNIHQADGFVVKGQKFDLSTLLDDRTLAEKYTNGTMVMARLCPSDYHRYHFPCDCIPGQTKLINGFLYSVNPIAIKKDVEIFTQNKRAYCTLETENFGDVIYMEIGATNVGSIHQTYTPYLPYAKGDEVGYFSFGGSSLILLFEPGKILLDEDLIAATKKGLEIRGLMGQSMGVIR